MKVQFRRDYYQKTKVNKYGENVVQDEISPMYHFILTEDYFVGDRLQALKLAIKDMKKEVKRLEEIDKNNDKSLDSWDSISK